MFNLKAHKILVTCVATSLGLICLSGCNSSDKKAMPDSVPSSTVGDTDSISAEEEVLQKYNDAIVSMEEALPFESTGLVVEYNGEELSFPFDMTKITSDEWSLSDRTWDNDMKKLQDKTDAAIYTSEKYSGSELILSSYKIAGQPGVAGKQEVLKEHGVYSLSLYCDAETTVYPPVNVCGADVFTTPADELISILDKSNTISQPVHMNDANIHSYVYDLGSYLIELRLVCRDGQVCQCLFTTTVATENNSSSD